MPPDGRKPITVHEAIWRAVKDLKEAEETPYDNYDDVIRDLAKNADNHFEVLSDEVREALDNGRVEVERETPDDVVVDG